MLEFIDTSEPWQGERISDVRHPKDIETKWSAEELTAIGLRVRSDPTPAPETDSEKQQRLKIAVSMERDGRIDSGFVYNGSEFQSDPGSRENIIGALCLSLGGMMADPQGNAGYRWADPNEDFAWTDKSNTQVKMTAAECQAFCQAAMEYKSELIKAARSLKDMSDIPEDYADDKYWPSRTLD